MSRKVNAYRLTTSGDVGGSMLNNGAPRNSRLFVLTGREVARKVNANGWNVVLKVHPFTGAGGNAGVSMTNNGAS